MRDQLDCDPWLHDTSGSDFKQKKKKKKKKAETKLATGDGCCKRPATATEEIFCSCCNRLANICVKGACFLNRCKWRDIKSGEVFFFFFFFFLAILRYGLWQADCLIDSACFTMYDCKTPAEQWSRTTTIQQNKECFHQLPSNFGLHFCDLLEQPLRGFVLNSWSHIRGKNVSNIFDSQWKKRERWRRRRICPLFSIPNAEKKMKKHGERERERERAKSKHGKTRRDWEGGAKSKVGAREARTLDLRISLSYETYALANCATAPEMEEMVLF